MPPEGAVYVVIESMDPSRRFVPEYLKKRLPSMARSSVGGGTKHRRGSVTHDQQELFNYLVLHHGAHSPDVWNDGSIHVVRPGKLVKDGSSASIIVGQDGDAIATVFSDNWTGLNKGSYILGVDGELHHPSDPLAKVIINVSTPAQPLVVNYQPGSIGVAPPQLDPAALYGIAGEVVATIRPHTEACDAALVVTLLVEVGNYIGRGPHFMVESDRHGCAVYATLVGESARGRKGVAAGRIETVMAYVDVGTMTNANPWRNDCHASGFGSGESVVEALDNAKRGSESRLFVEERELSGLLKVASKDGSILSSVLRNGWDGTPLRNRKVGSKLLATDYHLSVIGHITEAEVQRLLTSTEQCNGFANRFLWVHTERTQQLPFGGSLDPNVLAQVANRLAGAVQNARGMGQVPLAQAAHGRWEDIYRTIGDAELPGIVAALTNRAEAYVRRLALLYTVLDGKTETGLVHLEAAWALWRYCEASVLYIWGDATGDGDVDRLVAAARAAGSTGLSTTDAYETVFHKHRAVGPIAARAARYGLIRIEEVKTDGRSREVMYAL